MHVLILPSTFPTAKQPSGIFFKHQAEAIARNGVKVGVIAPDIRGVKNILNPSLYNELFKEYEYLLNNNIPVFRKVGVNILPKFSGWEQFIFTQYSHHLFKKYINKHGAPDVIHAHVGAWAGYAGMCISKKYNIPLIVTEHSTGFVRKIYSIREKKILIKVFNHAKLLVTVGNSLKREIEQFVPGKKVIVVPNIINLNYFQYNESGKNKDLVFALGNLNANKGFDVLIKAFAKALHDRPEIELKIGGDGPEKKKLKRLVRQLEIEKKVTFLGLLNHERIYENYKEAGIFALASNVETFGVVFIEAMAMGIPVIATRSGGPEDFVNEKNGILCNTGDVEGIKDAILTIMDNYHKYKAEDIRNYVIRTFNPDKIANDLITHYEDVKYADIPVKS